MKRSRLAVLSLALLMVAGTTEAGAGEIKIGGTGAALGTMRMLLDACAKLHPNLSGEVLPSLGSSGGIRAVLGGAIDLAVASRPLKDKERAAGAIATKFATTAIVPAVSAANPTNNLSSAELLALYRGEVKNWSDGREVRLVLRPESETDTKLLNQYIPEIKSAYERLRANPVIPVTYTDQENANAIERIPGSFGLVALAQIRAERLKLKALSLDGIEANTKTIADGSYPMRKSFYLVTKGAPGPQVRNFIAFVRSAEGQALLRQAGHAPEQE